MISFALSPSGPVSAFILSIILPTSGWLAICLRMTNSIPCGVLVSIRSRVTMSMPPDSPSAPSTRALVNAITVWNTDLRAEVSPCMNTRAQNGTMAAAPPDVMLHWGHFPQGSVNARRFAAASVIILSTGGATPFDTTAVPSCSSLRRFVAIAPTHSLTHTYSHVLYRSLQ